MSTTAIKIINGALRLLQVASDDVTIDAAEANDAFEALNMMIDSWSNESLMLYHIQREQFTLTPAHNPHTIGLVSADFITSVPIDIDQMTVNVGGIDYPIMQVQYDDYAVIKLKTLTNTYPEYFYLDKALPEKANLYLYPVPSSASTLTLYSRKPLTKFPSLTTAIELPPGYERALKFCLALEIAPEYQVSAGQDVLAMATTAKANIKRTNTRPITMQIDPAVLANSGTKRRFNIYTGQ